MTDDEMLDELADEMVSDTANALLDRQLGRAQKWVAAREAQGDTPTLREFIHKCVAESNKRNHVIAAYCTAMWRLMGRGDR